MRPGYPGRVGERAALALAVALLRGGVVLLALPFVVLPSSVGIATFVGPASITPTGPAPALLALGAAAAGLLLAWLAVSGLVAALLETVLVRLERADRDPVPAGRGAGPDVGPEPLAEPGRSPFLQARPAGSGPLPPDRAPRGRGPLRIAASILVARAIAALPIVLALGWAVPRLGVATYVELTRPADPALALPIRVVAAAPEALVVVALAWMVAAALGGLAARRVVLLGDGGPGAVWEALRAILRRPLTGGLLLAAGPVVAVPLLGVPLALARLAWEAVAVALPTHDGVVATLAPVAGFVAAWALALGSLALLATALSRGWTRFVLAGEERRRPAAIPLPEPALEPVGAALGSAAAD